MRGEDARSHQTIGEHEPNQKAGQVSDKRNVRDKHLRGGWCIVHRTLGTGMDGRACTCTSFHTCIHTCIHTPAAAREVPMGTIAVAPRSIAPSLLAPSPENSLSLPAQISRLWSFTRSFTQSRVLKRVVKLHKFKCRAESSHAKQATGSITNSNQNNVD